MSSIIIIIDETLPQLLCYINQNITMQHHAVKKGKILEIERKQLGINTLRLKSGF